MIVGGETGGRWLGGFDRSLRAVLLSPFVRQKLAMLASTENAEDLKALRELIETGQVTPAIDRTYPLSDRGSDPRHREPAPRARSSSRSECGTSSRSVAQPVGGALDLADQPAGRPGAWVSPKCLLETSGGRGDGFVASRGL